MQQASIILLLLSVSVLALRAQTNALLATFDFIRNDTNLTENVFAFKSGECAFGGTAVPPADDISYGLKVKTGSLQIGAWLLGRGRPERKPEGKGCPPTLALRFRSHGAAGCFSPVPCSL